MEKAAPRNVTGRRPSGSSSTQNALPLGEDLVWSAGEIAVEIGRSRRQTAWLLENGRLPAEKIGGVWVSSRTALRNFFNSKFAVTEAA